MPYLSADESLVDHWRRSLGDDAAFKVGVVWQGNPKYGGDRARSFPLAVLAPLAKVPGVKIFSLQKGLGSEQLADADFDVVDLGSRFSDEAMVDAAAVIRSLDLVVTCDTAMLHLAGALAAPVWVRDSFRSRLALDAGSPGQPLVSYAALVSPDAPRRLARGDRTYVDRIGQPGRQESMIRRRTEGNRHVGQNHQSHGPTSA